MLFLKDTVVSAAGRLQPIVVSSEGQKDRNSQTLQGSSDEICSSIVSSDAGKSRHFQADKFDIPEYILLLATEHHLCEIAVASPVLPSPPGAVHGVKTDTSKRHARDCPDSASSAAESPDYAREQQGPVIAGCIQAAFALLLYA